MPAPRRYSFALQPGETSDFLSVVNLPADVAEGQEEEEEEEEEGTETLEVVCPDGVSAGDTIFLQYGEDEIEVVVPEGVRPGDEFEVNLSSESPDEEQTSQLGDRIDDALDSSFVDQEAIAALIEQAQSQGGHPGLPALQAKLDCFKEKERNLDGKAITDSAAGSSQPEADAEIDLDKLLGSGAAALYDGAIGQLPKKAKKPQKGQTPKNRMKQKSSAALGVGHLELSGDDLDRKLEEKMAALETKFSGNSPQARNRSNSLRAFAKDQMQMIAAVVAEDTEAKLQAVDEATAMEAAAEVAAKLEAEAAAAEEARQKQAFMEEALAAKEAQAKLVEEAKQQAATREKEQTAALRQNKVKKKAQKDHPGIAQQEGNAALTKLERENSDLRSENSKLRRELSQIRVAQEARETAWQDERALHQEVVAAYARERELQRQKGPSWSMRTHAEVLAEIDRVRHEVATLADESADVRAPRTVANIGDADDESLRVKSSLGRPPQAGRRGQKKQRNSDSSSGNRPSTGRGLGKGKGKGKGNISGNRRGKGRKQSNRSSSESTRGSSDAPGLSAVEDDRRGELGTDRTDTYSDGL